MVITRDVKVAVRIPILHRHHQTSHLLVELVNRTPLERISVFPLGQGNLVQNIRHQVPRPWALPDAPVLVRQTN